MSDQNIFGENQNNSQSVTPTQNQPQLEQVTTLLASIKNENGEQKYKTLEDAIKALAHSQNFIPTLVNESKEKERIIQELQAKAQKIDTLENTLQELIQRQGTPKTDAVIDEDKIAELVNQTLTRTQQAALAQANQKKVIDKLIELHGEKAGEVFYAKAAEAGLDKAEINSLAAKSPSAVFKLLGVDAPQTNSQGVDQGTVNTTGFKPTVDSALSRNKESVLLGATSKQVVEESQRSRKLVDELHSQGLSVYDLTDPKVYAKYFG